MMFVLCMNVCVCVCVCGSTVLTRSTSSGNVQLLAGDLSSGRAFDNGCVCQLAGRHSNCHCGAPRLRAQLEFVGALMNISKHLSQLPTKDMRSKLMCLHSVQSASVQLNCWRYIASAIRQIPQLSVMTLNCRCSS